jgi:hypothetical protein
VATSQQRWSQGPIRGGRTVPRLAIAQVGALGRLRHVLATRKECDERGLTVHVVPGVQPLEVRAKRSIRNPDLVSYFLVSLSKRYEPNDVELQRRKADSSPVTNAPLESRRRIHRDGRILLSSSSVKS